MHNQTNRAMTYGKTTTIQTITNFDDLSNAHNEIVLMNYNGAEVNGTFRIDDRQPIGSGMIGWLWVDAIVTIDGIGTQLRIKRTDTFKISFYKTGTTHLNKQNHE